MGDESGVELELDPFGFEWEEGADDHGREGLPHGHALLVRGETGSEAWLEFLPPTLSDTLSGAVSAEY